MNKAFKAYVIEKTVWWHGKYRMLGGELEGGRMFKSEDAVS